MLPIVFLAVLVFASVSQAQEPSVADLARKTREKKSGTAKVLTNDHVGSVVDPMVSWATRYVNALKDGSDSASQRNTEAGDEAERAEQTAALLEEQGRDLLATNVLSSKNLDVQFQGRPDWTLRLHWQAQAYSKALRDLAKSSREYQDAVFQSKYDLTIQVEKLVSLRQALQAAVSKSDQESTRYRMLSEEGWTRATLAPNLPLCGALRTQTQPCK
jgi:hypothetical protein